MLSAGSLTCCDSTLLRYLMNNERFFNYLQYEKRFSPHTLIAYRNDLGQFMVFLEKMYELKEPADIRHIHIRSWMVDLFEKENVARSINRKLSCLKSWFRFLRKTGDLNANPMLKVIAPKSGKRLPVFMTEGSMSLLFEQADFGVGFSGIRNRLLMETLYCTGMRRSELVGLKTEDFFNAHFRVMGKGGKERLLPLVPHLVELIETYLRERKANFPDCPHRSLLLTDKGEPINGAFVYSKVKKYLSLVTTVEQRSPHVLRHSFATHLSNNGADLNAIKELLGHASLAATQIYTHNSIEKLRKVYEQAHPKAKLV